MRKLVTVMVAAVLLAGCSGDGSDGDAGPATTEGTTTTVDPEPVIRRYASAVAAARPALEDAVLPCAPLFDCAVEVAVAWDELDGALLVLADEGPVPGEIEGLVAELSASESLRSSLTLQLGDCSAATGDGDNPTQTCRAEAIDVLTEGAATVSALDGWAPYL